MPESDEINKLFEYSITMDSIDDAEDLFVISKDRILDINHWHNLSPDLNAVFYITDNRGKSLHRTAHKNDHIKITLPGQDGGSRWMRISHIVYDDYPDVNIEAFSIGLIPEISPEATEQQGISENDNNEIFILMTERHITKLITSLSATTSANDDYMPINWETFLYSLLNTDNS